MKKLTTLLLTLAMLVSISTTALAVDTPNKSYPQRFYDVPKDHWAFGYIAELVDRGVLAGYEDGSFKPEGTVSRAEFAKIMVGAAGVQTNDNSVYFSDMQNHWAIPYINAAKDYLTAYADNTYRPNQAAVREDVTMAMVKLKGYDVSSADFSYLANFADNNSISNNVKKYVAVAVEKDLISGFEDNTFRGQATLTRAEAATLLWRAFQYGNDNKVVDNNTTSSQPVVSQPTTPTQPTQVEPTQTIPTQTIPTQTQTTQPIATEEPTPEPTEKPYKIDTLVNANVNNSYNYTSDNSGNIYYVENNTVYKVSSQNSKTEKIISADDLIIDNEEMTLSSFEIESICIADRENGLFVLGKYNLVNAINNVNNHYLYLIYDGNKSTIVTDMFYDGADAICGRLENGDFVVNYGNVVRGNEMDRVRDERLHSSGNYYAYYEKDGGIYYAISSCINLAPFSKYDYSSSSTLWDASLTTTAAAITSNKVYFATTEGINIYNYSGKILETITTNDCEIKDKTSTNFNNVATKLLITSDDNIIFYDKSAKAFRMISGN